MIAAMKKLKKMTEVNQTIKVFRNLNYKEYRLIDSSELVPGDIYAVENK